MSGRVTRGCFFSIAVAVLTAAPAVAQSNGSTPPAPSNPFTPPPCTGTVFADVTCGTAFDAWIEQYAADLITGGCGGGLYCPNNPVTRAQMAVFVEKAMRGTAAWSPGDLGDFNTGLGGSALLNNTTSQGNTAIGSQALFEQSFDNGGIAWHSGNTAIGNAAMYHNVSTSTDNGIHNTAVGSQALFFNETGFSNTALGYQAGARVDTITGYEGTNVTFVPTDTGVVNTFLGMTGATAEVSNCTAVGFNAYCDANDQVRLGNFFVTSIGGKVGWSTLSDARAKTDIRDLDLGLPLVLALRPVSYRFKGGNGRADMGFVAQDVETLLGDGYNVVDVGGDAHRTLSLRYTELIAPLVKAVQEQQAQIEAQRSRIDDQKREIDLLTARLAEVGTSGRGERPGHRGRVTK